MPAEHLFWITSRAAGILALLLSTAAVSVGLLMGGRFVRRRGVDLRATHEALALAALAAIVVHAGSLLFDSFLSPSLLDLTIPFVSSYNRVFTTLGILCGWATALLGLSYYWRARIGVARWRRLHRWTALVWLMSIVHALGEGTDAGEAWFLLGVGALIVPALGLLAVRVTEPKGVTT
jgi:methionine sulfoxide reductase heme-binding subunit